jgi:ABC-type molybdate transport system permease subunit
MSRMTVDWSPLWIGWRVALAVSALALLVAPWPAWWLARRNWPAVTLLARFLSIVPAIVAIMLAAPALAWPWVVAAGLVRAVPYTLETCRAAFRRIDPGYAKAARVAGASDGRIFRAVGLPLAGGAALAAAAEVFAEAMLEMGVALALGGRLSAAPAGAMAVAALAASALGQWLRREGGR